MAKINKVINVKVEGVGKIKQLEDSLKKLRKQQRDIKKDMKDGANAGKHAEAQYKKNENAIKGQSKALRDTKKAMLDANNATKKGTSLQKSMTMGVIKGAAAFTILLTAFRRVSQALTTMIGTFTEFEFTMAKVKAVSGANAEEFKRLSDQAQELGRSTFFTASEVANLQLNLSKLGFTVVEIEQATQGVINLSIATGSDLARAATVAGNAIRGFQLDASETTRVVDVMAVAFTSSALDIEKWQTSMTKVAPIAAMAGFSIEETAAIMAKLSDTGIEASIAGTSLRNILLKMQDPTSELTKKVGHTITNLDQMLEVFKELQDEGTDLADILSFMDVRQVAAFGTMLEGAEDIKALRDELMLADGAGQRMADTVGDTLQGSIFKVKSALQGVSIALVQQFGGALKNTLKRFAEWLNSLVENEEKLKKFWETVKFTTKMIFAFVIGLKPARAALKYLAADTALASGAMSGLTIATNIAKFAVRALKVAIVSTGIGILIIGLGELVAWLMFSQTETERLADVTDDYGRKIQDIIDRQKILEDIDKKVIDNTTKKSKAVDILVRAYNRAEATEKDRLKILGKLADISEKHFGHLRGQVNAFEDAEIAAESYKEELKKLARVEATKGALIDVEDNILKMEMEYKRSVELVRVLRGDVLTLFENLGSEGFGGYDFAGAVEFYRTWMGEEDDKFLKAFDKIQAGLGDELIEARRMRDELNILIDKMDIDDLFDFEPEDKTQLAQYTMQELIDREKALVTMVENENQHQINMLEAKKRGIEAFRIQDNVSDAEEKRSLIQLNATKRSLNKSYYKQELEELTINRDAEKIIAEEEISDDAKKKEKLSEIQLQFLKDKKKLAELYNVDIAKMDNEIHLETIKKNKDTFRRMIRELDTIYEEEKYALDLRLANKEISESEHNLRMMELTRNYLNQKLKLFDLYSQDTIQLDEQVRTHTIETLNAQEQAMREYIGALGDLGGFMQDVAGEEEEMNAVRKAGIIITQAAATAEQIMALMTTLSTLATAADIAITPAKVGADGAKTASTIMLAGATFLKSIADGIRGLPWWAQLIGIIAIVAAIRAAKRNITSAFKGTSTTSTPSSSLPSSSSSYSSSSSSGGGGAGSYTGLMTFGGQHTTLGTVSQYADGGMVYGNSHSQGGEKFAVGGRVVELEGGEAVINKRSSKMFRSQLSAMNYAGGGVKFADGGITNIPSFAQTQFAVSGQENMRNAARTTSKVVVVEADITNSQNKVTAIEAEASF